MDASQIVAVVTLVGAGLLLPFARARVPEAVRVRADLAPHEVYEQYYAESGLPRELVADVLTFIAGELEMPVAKLRPSDGFDTTLREVTRQWDSGMAQIFELLESEARRRKFPLQRPIETIDDYIRAYCAVDAAAQGGDVHF